ncbi:DUF2510 domain-containing protein [Demequina zhanjiangensis]|uniref:DUF2510 domain-containing protein n=1 Tax=Demequina zhanjiangensis TaxID=3051659 RepID=A0ABT8G2T0_9MICO|nr:DUF2510 domain-containing protein [Demequina sp. SYSU T00b26]MDN4473456.1 DUF2510 domain-containing protein [Demequina sp. SYSU T00b26]
MPGGDGQVRRPKLPQAGWLPDPSVIGVERYWDGRAWTSRTRDAETGLDCVDPLWTEFGEMESTREERRPRRERRVAPVLPGVESPRRLPGRVGEGWYAGFAVFGVIVMLTVSYLAVVSGTVRWSAYAGGAVPEGPAIDYPVFGSDARSVYLARSLIAQEDTVDVGWLTATGETAREILDDAMLEVAAQNPYVYIDPTGWSFTDDATQIIPSYRYGDAEAENRRSQTAAVVERIVTSTEVQEADGDVAVLRALHDALIETAEFDQAAFDARRNSLTTSTYAAVTQSQEAYGALVAGRAVGEGYAKAFQALADAAGYRSVVITGTAADGQDVLPHAWNRVYVGGSWLVVDAAWDDGGADGSAYDYFLVASNDPKLDSRAIDADWIVDGMMWGFGM